MEIPTWTDTEFDWVISLMHWFESRVGNDFIVLEMTPGMPLITTQPQDNPHHVCCSYSQLFSKHSHGLSICQFRPSNWANFVCANNSTSSDHCYLNHLMIVTSTCKLAFHDIVDIASRRRLAFVCFLYEHNLPFSNEFVISWVVGPDHVRNCSAGNDHSDFYQPSLDWNEGRLAIFEHAHSTTG